MYKFQSNNELSNNQISSNLKRNRISYKNIGNKLSLQDLKIHFINISSANKISNNKGKFFFENINFINSSIPSSTKKIKIFPSSKNNSQRKKEQNKVILKRGNSSIIKKRNEVGSQINMQSLESQKLNKNNKYMMDFQEVSPW